MRLLKLCALLLISFTAYTQTNIKLTIQVEDVKGNQLQTYQARILNYSINPQIQINGKTQFILFSKGTYEILVSAEGYADKITLCNIEDEKNITIQLDAIYSKLNDIVVTVDKRETSLHTSAASISSLNASQLHDMRIWEISDLTGLAPNLYLSNSGDNRNITGIRGIVTTSYDQAISTYIDGVAQFSLDSYIPQLIDIENIEIIRGAQGTIYGRNSMGGVINITTKRPTNKISAYADAQFANYGQQRYSAGIKTPLIKDKLFGSVSFMHDTRNGFYTNDFNTSDFDQQNQTLLELKLRYLINNQWSIESDHKRYIGRNHGTFPLVNDLDELNNNPYHLSQNSIGIMKDRTENSSIVIRRKGTKVNISLQSSLQRNYRFYNNNLDGDFSSYDIVSIFNNYGNNFNTVSVLTNELRLSSTQLVDSKINWSAGIFHFIQKSPTKQATVFGEDAGFYGIPETNFAIISTNDAKNSGIAAYTHVKHEITKKIAFNAGLRIDIENRQLTVKGEYGITPEPIAVIFPDTTGKTNYSAFSPKFGFQFTPDEKHILYINYSRGFRTGGLSNISSDPSQPPLNSFRPEFSNMFEIGFKGENSSKIFRYNAVIFANAVTDIQAPQLLLPEAITIIRNAGKMNSSGAELELMYKPVKGLMIQYAGGLTQAKYKSLKGVSNGSEIDLSNKKQVYTPNTTQYIAVQYQLKIRKSDLTIRTEYNHVGDQFFDLANQIKQKAYGLINFRAGYRISSVEMSVWGRNLAGKNYIDYAYDFGAAHLGDPRMIGIGLGWRL